MAQMKRLLRRGFKLGLRHGLPYFLAQKYAKLYAGKSSNGEFIDYCKKAGAVLVKFDEYYCYSCDEVVCDITYRLGKLYIYYRHYGVVFDK